MSNRKYLIGINLAVFISSLDTSIVNTILNPLSQELAIDTSQSIWIVFVYHLAILSTMLFFGNYGEKKGYSNLIYVGILIFTLSSFFCGYSQDFILLILSRFFQGIGASIILVCNTALIKQLSNVKSLGQNIGFNAMVIAAGFSLGPTLASFLIQYLNWKWLFYMNIPIGILSLYLIYNKRVEALKISNFNWIGNGLFSVIILIFFLGIDLLKDQRNITVALLFLIISLIIAYGFFNIIYPKDKKLLPIDLIKIQSIRFSLVGTFSLFFIQSLVYILFPLVFITILKIPQKNVGLFISPWPFMATLIAPLSGYLSDRIKPKLLSKIGLTILTISLFRISFQNELDNKFKLIILMLCCGIGFGLFQSPNIKNVMKLSPLGRDGSVSSLLGITRILGQLSGSLFLSYFLTYFTVQQWIFALYVGVLIGLIGIIFLNKIKS